MNFFSRVRFRTASELMLLKLRAQGIEADPTVRLYGKPLIHRHPGSQIIIGPNARLISDSRLTDLGVNHQVILRTVRDNAKVELGEDVGISGGTICCAISIAIGTGTLLGANVTIVDTDFHPLANLSRRYVPMPAPSTADAVIIGRNVFIGTGALILKGSEIGDNSVIGAGAVVSGKVPPNSIFAGNPARHIRSLQY